MKWNERGPNNVGGRTKGLMFDPNDSSEKLFLLEEFQEDYLKIITSQILNHNGYKLQLDFLVISQYQL